MKVYVVISLEYGWDCVYSVYNQDEVTYEELEKAFPEDCYVISDKTTETREELLDLIAENEAYEIRKTIPN